MMKVPESGTLLSRHSSQSPLDILAAKNYFLPRFGSLAQLDRATDF